MRRRLEAIDLRIRLELALIVLLINAFLFWQARVRFASAAHAGGPAAVALQLGVAMAAMAAAGGALSGACHLRHLRGSAPGPTWLALPLPPGTIARQLLWEARLPALWMALPAPGILLAAAGLMPVWWLVILTGAFVWMLLEAGRLACALAWRVALRSAERFLDLHPLVRLLATRAAPGSGGGPLRGARWSRTPAWRALCRKDLLLSLRPTAARRRLIAPLAFGALAVASWAVAAPPLAAPLAERLGGPVTASVAHVLAFGLSLIAAATLGEWLIALSGEDPFAVLRVLPVGIGTVWGARLAWVVLSCAALAAGHGLAARPLDGGAHGFFLLWTTSAALAIGVLAVNYGLTLFPHEPAAQRIYTLSLGLALAGSLMIPLMGWVVLLTAVLHSARRLGRWPRLEATP